MDQNIFNRAVEGWIEHCEQLDALLNSSAQTVRRTPYYNIISSMGHQALPFIREVYARDSSENFALHMVQGHGLVGLVKEIVGDDFQIPTELGGQVSDIAEYTKQWLDTNMDKYLATK